jgi:hypothetical protein
MVTFAQSRDSAAKRNDKGLRDAHGLTVILLTVLLATSSMATAKPRQTVQRHANPVAAPEDPQATAMRNARNMWPGRALCDFGGYRIIPCDNAGRF